MAVDDCKRAIDIDGDEPTYRDSLGWAYLRLDDARSAVRAFDGAIKLKPLAFTLYGRALAQQRLGQAAAAQRDLAAARSPNVAIDTEVRRAGLPVAADAPGADAAAPGQAAPAAR